MTPGNGGSVHAASVTRDALAAGVLEVPALARVPQPPPPLPNPFTQGPAEPTSVKPFALTLAAALVLYATVVALLLADRQRRQQRTIESEPWWDEAAS